MKRIYLLIVLLVAASALGQGGRIGGNGRIGGSGVIGTGSSAGYSVTKVGTLNAGFTGPYTVTTTGAIPSGDIALWTCGTDGANTGTLYSFTTSDSSSNSWTFPTVSTNTSQEYLDSSNGYGVGYSFSLVGTQIANGGHITFTPSVDQHWGCDLFDVHGPSVGLDQSAGSTSASGANIASSSITPGVQPTVAFGMFLVNNGSTFSAYGNIMGSSATGLDEFTITGASRFIAFEWLKLTALTAGTSSITIVTNNNGATLFFTLK